jgi:hypothetical protein
MEHKGPYKISENALALDLAGLLGRVVAGFFWHSYFSMRLSWGSIDELQTE